MESFFLGMVMLTALAHTYTWNINMSKEHLYVYMRVSRIWEVPLAIYKTYCPMQNMSWKIFRAENFQVSLGSLARLIIVWVCVRLGCWAVVWFFETWMWLPTPVDEKENLSKREASSRKKKCVGFIYIRREKRCRINVCNNTFLSWNR